MEHRYCCFQPSISTLGLHAYTGGRTQSFFFVLDIPGSWTTHNAQRTTPQQAVSYACRPLLLNGCWRALIRALIGQKQTLSMSSSAIAEASESRSLRLCLQSTESSAHHKYDSNDSTLRIRVHRFPALNMCPAVHLESVTCIIMRRAKREAFFSSFSKGKKAWMRISR